jgi:hypothetical protein
MYILVPSISSLSSRSMVLSEREKEVEYIEPENLTGYSNFTLSFAFVTDYKLKFMYGRCSETHCTNSTIYVEYKYYDSYEGEGQKSGVYIFRDAAAGAESKSYNKLQGEVAIIGDVVSFFEVQGDKVDTQIIVFNNNPHQTATVVSRVKGIEGEHGKEVTINISTDEFKSEGFYTDSNGMISEKRELNKRNYPLTNLTGFEVVSNFYPVNSAISIKSNDTSLEENPIWMTVLTDRAQSASSLRSGEVEFLIDRRTFFDDDRGVEEPLNETVSGKPIIVETYHHVVLGHASELTHANYMETKRLQRTVFEEPLQALFAPFDELSQDSIDSIIKFEKKKGLKYIGSIPPSIKIVTKALGPSKIMIRMYNMNERLHKLENFIDVDLSGVIADLAELREESGHNVAFKITQWNLSLNKQIGRTQKINWKLENGKAVFNGRKNEIRIDNIISLHNQEMKSFMVEFETDEVSASVY